MPTFRQQLKGRFATLGIVVLLMLGVLLVRLWSMQVIAGESYAAMADDNRVREIPIDAPRGRILDRNKRPLVSNRSSMAVLGEPSLTGHPDTIASLSGLLDVPVDEIESRLESVKEAPLEPRVIAFDVPMETVAYLEEHETLFPGTEVRTIAVRQYPYHSLAAHVLGYTGEISDLELKDADISGYEAGDVVGKTGAERQFEGVLQGDKGSRRIEVDARGRPRRVLQELDPVPGRDVILTVDRDLQKVTEEALAQALEDAHKEKYRKAKAGAAVVLDVRTGEVLSMASLPTYDPELFLGGIAEKDWKRLNSKESEYPLNNRVTMSAYAPGSTFKAITGLAGLRYGLASEWKQFYCPGKWTEMGEQWPKWCWNKAGHGTVSFHEGIADSCDTVFYEIGYSFYKRKKEELQSFSREFGLGSPTGIDLPGEVDGRVPDAAWKRAFNESYPEYRAWLPGDTVNMAIGQGDLLLTPLQLASVYAGIANDGKVMRPHVLKSVLDGEGRPATETAPVVAYRPKVDKADLAIMRRGLLSVTQDGTAEGAFRGFGADVCGKTGTAQVYGKDDYAWFAAFAPAAAPKYAVVVMVEQGGHGGSVAAPAARQILAKALGLPVEHVRAYDESR